MNMTKLNSVTTRTVAAGCLLGLLMAAQSAVACTVDNWDLDSGNVDGAGPQTGVARYSGLCAMDAPADTASWVQHNIEPGINRIRARFYVLNNLDSGSTPIYRGFSTTAGSGSLFTVIMNSGGSVVLRDDATGETVNQGGATNWLSVEIDWSQGAGDGQISLSVNGQPFVSNSALNNTGDALASARLGNLGGAAGTLNFDAYESRRSTEIGRLCRGNPDGDGTRDINDLQELFTEIQSLGATPTPGTPDADEDGNVGLGDLSVVFQFIQSLQSDCAAFPG